ncbi:MAG: hypothetical protein PVSMB7_23820 [Chloroflexota bacterium]
MNSLGGVAGLASLSGFLAGIQGPPITVGGVTIPSFGVVLQALQYAAAHQRALHGDVSGRGDA